MHNVSYYLSQQARKQPDVPAVRAPIRTLPSGKIEYVTRTFAQLDAESSAVCRYFAQRGVHRGSRVLLLVRPGLDLIRIVFALFKMGAVPVTIDPGMGLRGLLRCVKRSEPEFVVGVPAAILVSRCFRPSFRSVRKRIVVGRAFTRDIERMAKETETYPAIDAGEDELAAILFTSGSTGPAKGVCYAHGMFAAQVESIRENFAIMPGEVDLPMLPVFALFNPALGMTTVVPQMNPSRPATVNPANIVRAIRQNAVTNSFGSPALWARIVSYCERSEIILPSIRRLLIAGAPVPPDLLLRLQAICPEGTLHTPYGATEALPVTSIHAAQVLEKAKARQAAGEGTCVGTPLKGIELKIIQPVDGVIADLSSTEALPAGAIGEIIVKGAVVTHAYDQLDLATREAKIIDETGAVWHRMGDLGYLDTEGWLWFCGRKAERVKTSDGWLYTDCCEAIFNAHPSVFRSALIGIGPENAVPAIVVEPETEAWPKSRDQRTKFIDELQKLGQQQAHTRQIKHFFFNHRFPVDVRHNAKIHRRTLAKMYQNKL